MIKYIDVTITSLVKLISSIFVIIFLLVSRVYPLDLGDINLDVLYNEWECKIITDKKEIPIRIDYKKDVYEIKFNRDNEACKYKILSRVGNSIVIRHICDNNDPNIAVLDLTSELGNVYKMHISEVGSLGINDIVCETHNKHKNNNIQSNTNKNIIDRAKREELCNKIIGDLISHEEYNYRISSYDMFGDLICKAKLSNTLVKLIKPGMFNKTYELVLNIEGQNIIIKANPDQDTDYVKRSKSLTKDYKNFNNGNEKFMEFEIKGKDGTLKPKSIIDGTLSLDTINVMFLIEKEKKGIKGWNIFATNPDGTNRP